MEQGGKRIDFKPITQGLGFHPFSDGLPYAPVSKAAQRPQATPHTPLSREMARELAKEFAAGAGAISAGQPGFAYPPRVTVPVASPAPKVSVPVQKHVAKAAVAKEKAAPAVSPQ